MPAPSQQSAADLERLRGARRRERRSLAPEERLHAQKKRSRCSATTQARSGTSEATADRVTLIRTTVDNERRRGRLRRAGPAGSADGSAARALQQQTCSRRERGRAEQQAWLAVPARARPPGSSPSESFARLRKACVRTGRAARSTPSRGHRDSRGAPRRAWRPRRRRARRTSRPRAVRAAHRP